ncbi:hypothetical protein A3766_15925 [Oleiphilus sp. HI0132]|nr:hypothetical protein A3766_15925 [Oleiphilus sp. HI0132]
MTIRMYATHKKLPLEHVEVSLSHERNYVDDCSKTEDGNSKMEALIRKVQLIGPLSAEEKERIIQIADRCPVHKTLHNNPHVVTTLVE